VEEAVESAGMAINNTIEQEHDVPSVGGDTLRFCLFFLIFFRARFYFCLFLKTTIVKKFVVIPT